ncbi:TPA: DUF3265 domain-containing protein [Vibrio vulnificus]|nr:DUF3265 domain-containing protein [Vibrio vulnificus]EGR9083625.1 DUF3265 domain-containing protein [Vibrio parahaemolyticus]EGR0237746.1 DUF3265 domain-containing protein [Vibrio vulnificus]HAS8187214.1 DUF3265 domain-containing protein [Vibrio vulnificus]HAS8232718.1 DUF3265 domain-containing protein [Vibrio vulnificus]
MRVRVQSILLQEQADVALLAVSNITICLRVIRNAWRFCYALRFVFKVACGNSGIALLTP